MLCAVLLGNMEKCGKIAAMFFEAQKIYPQNSCSCVHAVNLNFGSQTLQRQSVCILGLQRLHRCAFSCSHQSTAPRRAHVFDFANVPRREVSIDSAGVASDIQIDGKLPHLFNRIQPLFQMTNSRMLPRLNWGIKLCKNVVCDQCANLSSSHMQARATRRSPCASFQKWIAQSAISTHRAQISHFDWSTCWAGARECTLKLHRS